MKCPRDKVSPDKVSPEEVSTGRKVEYKVSPDEVSPDEMTVHEKYTDGISELHQSWLQVPGLKLWYCRKTCFRCGLVLRPLKMENNVLQKHMVRTLTEP